MMNMKTTKALALSLGELSKPVITEYQMGLVIYAIYRDKSYKGESIALKKPSAESSDFNLYLNKLLSGGVLNHHKDLPRGVYALLGNASGSAEEVSCTVDPFAYVSHLSAMEHHGLTDRMPAKLFLSSPSPREWRLFAQEKMEKDLGVDYDLYRQSRLPLLTRISLEKIGRTEVHRFNSKHHGAYKNVRDKVIRISTMGRTFLDMLRSPDLCGGINHVLDVYGEHAEKYLRLITDEIDANGKPIDKVRAGYILSERLGINDLVVESWAKFAQRGGSRKLDASTEYIPKWSDRWCLSLNIFENI